MVKYYFAVDGVVKFSQCFNNDADAFAHRCALEKADHCNWKVYNDRFDLIYGILIAQ